MARAFPEQLGSALGTAFVLAAHPIAVRLPGFAFRADAKSLRAHFVQAFRIFHGWSVSLVVQTNVGGGLPRFLRFLRVRLGVLQFVLEGSNAVNQCRLLFLCPRHGDP
jgi:hypothetical protein